MKHAHKTNHPDDGKQDAGNDIRSKMHMQVNAGKCHTVNQGHACQAQQTITKQPVLSEAIGRGKMPLFGPYEHWEMRIRPAFLLAV